MYGGRIAFLTFAIANGTDRLFAMDTARCSKLFLEPELNGLAFRYSGTGRLGLRDSLSKDEDCETMIWKTRD